MTPPTNDECISSVRSFSGLPAAQALLTDAAGRLAPDAPALWLLTTWAPGDAADGWRDAAEELADGRRGTGLTYEHPELAGGLTLNAEGFTIRHGRREPRVLPLLRGIQLLRAWQRVRLTHAPEPSSLALDADPEYEWEDPDCDEAWEPEWDELHVAVIATHARETPTGRVWSLRLEVDGADAPLPPGVPTTSRGESPRSAMRALTMQLCDDGWSIAHARTLAIPDECLPRLARAVVLVRPSGSAHLWTEGELNA